jgi:F-type H+-transporting ATPase subunit delta
LIRIGQNSKICCFLNTYMAKTHSIEQIAKRYAKALYGLAGTDAPKLLPEVEKLSAIAALDDVKAFAYNPLFTREQQASVMRALLESQGISKLLVDAVARMSANRRLALLPSILRQFRSMVMEATGEMELDIISAKPLNENDIKLVTEKLSAIYNKKIHAHTTVDTSLIGGIMIKMQDRLIDYSVAGKLNRLGHYLKTT